MQVVRHACAHALQECSRLCSTVAAACCLNNDLEHAMMVLDGQQVSVLPFITSEDSD